MALVALASAEEAAPREPNPPSEEELTTTEYKSLPPRFAFYIYADDSPLAQRPSTSGASFTYLAAGHRLIIRDTPARQQLIAEFIEAMWRKYREKPSKFGRAVRDPNRLTIRRTRDGKVAIGKKRVNEADLARELAALVAANPKIEVLPEGEGLYQACEAAGIKNILVRMHH